MYALEKIKIEWELKNEMAVGPLARVAVDKTLVASVALAIIVLRATLGIVVFIFQKPKMIREVGPGQKPEEAESRYVRLYEHGPFIR